MAPMAPWYKRRRRRVLVRQYDFIEYHIMVGVASKNWKWGSAKLLHVHTPFK
jgi:hypothetical protein